jgi:hypothetical protein
VSSIVHAVCQFDDMAYNTNLMFSPESFERRLRPAYRRMIAACKQVGALFPATGPMPPGRANIVSGVGQEYKERSGHREI